jgi:hypothetical protein
MLSDTLAEAVWDIEEYEKTYPEMYADLAEEIRKVKLEMMILQGRLDMVPPIAETITPTDLEWIRAEALKRGAERPPFEFEAVFDECWRDFWKKWKKTNDLDSMVIAWAASVSRAAANEIGGQDGQQ